ncbi:hypothetical protein ACHAXT_003649 [Thalassiosira profunda]
MVLFAIGKRRGVDDAWRAGSQAQKALADSCPSLGDEAGADGEAAAATPRAPQNAEESGQIVYRLSCRGSQMISLSVYVGRPVMPDDLPGRLRKHFGDVWKLLQRDDVSRAMLQQERGEGDFASSPLAADLARHCRGRGLAAKRDVVRWCQEHVKVEVERWQVDPELLGHKQEEEKAGKGRRMWTMRVRERYGAATI